VAIKFLSPALAGHPAVAARFAREVALLRALEHPAIVRVLAHGDEGGVPFYVMELVDGVDLRARLGRGTLSRAELGAIFGRLLAALAHAHEKGVVHRDLKPANVLLAVDGAKLADFGVAHLETGAGAGPPLTRITETAAVIGTLPYMAPEQRAGAGVDRRADLFSIGVMLYEAVTGILPQGAFPAPSALNPAFGRRFDRLVMELLAPKADDRPATAAVVAEALERALRAPAGRARWWMAGAGLAVAAAGVLAAGPLREARRTAPKGESPIAVRQAANVAPPAANVAPPAANAAPVNELPDVKGKADPAAPLKSTTKPTPRSKSVGRAPAPKSKAAAEKVSPLDEAMVQKKLGIGQRR
jgi:serine/threonine-protein kinase